MDDRLARALRSLPRERAGSAFTETLLRRLATGGESRRRFAAPRRTLLAAVAAVLLVGLGLGAREWWHLRQQQQVTARLADLEAERRDLVEELEALRRQMAGALPVVYLGGSNELDLVLDLEYLRRTGSRPEEIPRRLAQAARWQALGAGTPARPRVHPGTTVPVTFAVPVANKVY